MRISNTELRANEFDQRQLSNICKQQIHIINNLQIQLREANEKLDKYERIMEGKTA